MTTPYQQKKERKARRAPVRARAAAHAFGL
jgi:hypothetical protein